jgi:hypothetical protein
MAITVEQMAANNAAWLEMATAALGIGGEFTPVLWHNTHDLPPIFPNADTLGGTPAEQVAAIEELVKVREGKVVAVKDSWGILDLSGLGFEPLFEAEWLHREPLPLAQPEDDLQIKTVTTPEGLREFALACNGPDIPPAVYSPDLLNRPDVRWLVGKREGAVVAGVTAVRAHELNGINNLFAEDDGQRQQLLAAGVGAFPEVPACGYEGADAVGPYLPLGFERAGLLRVWVRPAQG